MNKRSIMDGIAPMNGPKKGITLVIPTTTLIRTVRGNPKTVMAIKHIIPMIMESMIFPLIKPPKVLLHSSPNSKILAALSLEKAAKINFFA